MAHQITNHDKQQGIKQAWHGLTEIVPDITLENNWLRDWDISPTPLFFQDGEESGFSLLSCSDNPKIRVGGAYSPATFRPITNAEFLKLVEDSISGTNHKIVSIGSVKQRGRVFVSFELNGMEKFKAAGREFSAFLNFGNGHDKSSVLWVGTSNLATVCNNCFNFNLHQIENSTSGAKDDIKIRVRHTKNATVKFPEIAKLIDKAVGVQAEFAIEMERAASIPVNENVARNIFAGFIVNPEVEKISTRTSNNIDRLVQLFKSGAGNRGENMADVFSAVTDYYSHESAGEDRAKQFLSSEYGDGAKRKANFFNLMKRNGLDEVAKRGELLAMV